MIKRVFRIREFDNSKKLHFMYFYVFLSKSKIRILFKIKKPQVSIIDLESRATIRFGSFYPPVDFVISLPPLEQNVKNSKIFQNYRNVLLHNRLIHSMMLECEIINFHINNRKRELNKNKTIRSPDFAIPPTFGILSIRFIPPLLKHK